MSSVHHIHRQQLVLEAGAVSPQAASVWHRRLEQLHKRSLVPALNRQLDVLAPRGETIVLDRVEVSLTVADIADLEEDLGHTFSLALAKALNHAQRQPAPAPDGLYLLRHFLETGNFPAGSPPIELVSEQLLEEMAKWPASAWSVLADLLSANLPQRVGRLTQVPGKVAEHCFFALLACRPASLQPRLRKAYARSAKATSVWQAVLGEMSSPTTVGREVLSKEEAPTLVTAQPDVRIPIQADFYLENAGLVILHPYINYLAKQRETFTETGDLNPHYLAALLHYAVSPGQDFAEWEHPLTKILLGLQPDEELSPHLLNDEDRLAVDELLRGVIGHWSVLKRTSPDGLRQGFLQRPGKLYREGGGWRLLVEYKAQDLLLAHLPWSIGLVKTPWMAELLQVDWS
ncbi:contractile injection system tape measure protein [Neolewinella persica]|uniref:contractile injection system tape measure protein n=1 Tax=Neolewinella persica TaxID=70998 RepID=UPI0003615EE4|nr:contractile injection system tape measure protein [Neolewinella persica]